MRSRDLVIDGTTEYYYTTSDTYLKWAHNAERAVIVDATAGRWRLIKDRATLVDTWTRVPGGQEVLADIYPARGRTDPEGNPYKPRRMAVRTQALRGEWEAARQQVVEARKARQVRQREQAEKVAAAEQPCVDLVTALTKLGVGAVVQASSSHAWAQVNVHGGSAPLLTAAVQHLLDTGWTPPDAG
jgi:hypothetical protein